MPTFSFLNIRKCMGHARLISLKIQERCPSITPCFLCEPFLMDEVPLFAVEQDGTCLQ